MQTQNTTAIKLSSQSIHFKGNRAWKKLGLIALATDLTCERDFARLIPHELAGLYTTRVQFDNPTTVENLRNMAPRLSNAASLLLPGEPLDAICYSCTAASVVIGDAAITEAIQLAHPGVPVVTPSGAARMAFAALNVKKIAVLTPYLIETSEPMAAYFCQHGMEITQFECFGLEDDRAMARLHQDDIVEAACKIDTPDTEALFLSCTALPAIAVINDIEKRTGKPVVTSNQASAWAMIGHAELDHQPSGYGRLFNLGLPINNKL